MQAVALWNESRTECIGRHIEVADTSISRMRGLLGRKSMQPGEGLWIRPSSGIHTFGMAFPIDVIGVGFDMRVVKLWQNVRPQRITFPLWTVHSVVELAAGRIAETGVEVGDLLFLHYSF